MAVQVAIAILIVVGMMWIMRLVVILQMIVIRGAMIQTINCDAICCGVGSCWYKWEKL